MAERFFVMLTTQHGGIVPLTIENPATEDDELAIFSTKRSAESGAKSSILGSAFGYEVFKVGDGC